MVSFKSSLILLAQALTVTATTPYPKTTTTTTPTASTYSSTSTSSVPTNCPPPNYERVNITSPNKITTGKPFTISWESSKPDSSKNNTEARVELWAMNAGPVNSPLPDFKSDRLFDINNFTYTFNTTYVNATTKGGPIIWNLAVFVYSTYFDRNITDVPSWELPYYELQKVTFV